MSYSHSLEDLAVFTPLYEPEMREGTDYIELYPSEPPKHYSCWLPGSLLLKEAAFDFFTKSFYRADDDFDFYSFQKLQEFEIQILASDIASFIVALRESPTSEIVFSRYASVFGKEIWAEVSIDALAAAVISCGEELNRFIIKETKNSKILCVLGM